MLAAEDLQQLMAERFGRRFMHDLLTECRVFDADTFDESHARMSMRAGARMVGMRLLHRINAKCPRLYLQMMQEAHEDNERRNRNQ